MGENSLKGFFDILPDIPEEFDKEYFEIEDEFYNMFGHRVPRQMISDAIDDEQIKEAMKECIKLEKDNLFQLLGIEIKKDVLY